MSEVKTVSGLKIALVVVSTLFVISLIATQPIVRQFAPGGRTIDPAAALSDKMKNFASKIKTKATTLDDNITKIRNKSPSELVKMSLPYVVVSAGIAGATALAYTIYQRVLSAAAKSCKKFKGKEKTKCMLRFKINAANQAIDKLQEMMVGCQEKKDPDKCKYSIQKQIWNWTRRKQKYQEKLSRLEQTKPPSGSVFRTRKSY